MGWLVTGVSFGAQVLSLQIISAFRVSIALVLSYKALMCYSLSISAPAESREKERETKLASKTMRVPQPASPDNIFAFPPLERQHISQVEQKTREDL